MDVLFSFSSQSYSAYLDEWIHHTRSRGGVQFNRISFRLRLNPKCRLPTLPTCNSSVARLNPLSVIKFYDKLSQRVTWEYYGRVRYVTGARRSSLDPTRVSSCCSARTNRVSFRRTKLSSRTLSTKRYRRLLYTYAKHSADRHGLLGVHGLYIFATAVAVSHYDNINIICLI